MNQIKTGELIRCLRQEKNLTQLALAEKLGVSDKAVSKWERGCCLPDISLFPSLSAALGIDTEVLLRGELDENTKTSGNLKKIKCCVCPECGNIIIMTDSADVSCCGKRLAPLELHTADGENDIDVSVSDGEWYITSKHSMNREHYISFVAFITGDTLIVKKQYPEWGLETKLPFFAHGTLLWYCTQHGMFYKEI